MEKPFFTFSIQLFKCGPKHWISWLLPLSSFRFIVYFCAISLKGEQEECGGKRQGSQSVCLKCKIGFSKCSCFIRRGYTIENLLCWSQTVIVKNFLKFYHLHFVLSEQ